MTKTKEAAKHTKGPLAVRKADVPGMYRVETEPIERGAVDAFSGAPVGPERILTARVSGQNALADATLYAASPDLLEAAKYALDILRIKYPNGDACIEAVEAAIARAEGK